MTFELATLADLDEIVSLVNGAYRGESSRQGWTTEADFLGGQRTDKEKLVELAFGNDSVIVVAKKGVLVSGCVNLAKIGSESYLGMLTVAPHLQGQGLGKCLISYAENWAKEKWKSRSMSMTVITLREELIGFYVRRGYQRTGEMKPFPYGDTRFGLPLRNDLQFEVLRKHL